MTPSVCRLFCAFAVVGWTSASRASSPAFNAQVVVNIDLTAEGRKVPPPSAGKPAYYVPVILGYHEAGRIVRGEIPPARKTLLKELGRALAKQGYVLQALRPDANRTVPSLIVSVEWGSLNPDTVNFGSMDLSTGEGGTMNPSEVEMKSSMAEGIADFNQSQMLTLVGGSSFYRRVQFTQNEWEKLRDAVAEGRYFVIVSAYDFAASLKGEQKLLWRARMSTERQGVFMDDVVGALIEAGAPVFGREMDRPQFVVAAIREGKVEIGTPIVVPDQKKADENNSEERPEAAPRR